MSLAKLGMFPGSQRAVHSGREWQTAPQQRRETRAEALQVLKGILVSDVRFRLCSWNFVFEVSR